MPEKMSIANHMPFPSRLDMCWGLAKTNMRWTNNWMFIYISMSNTHYTQQQQLCDKRTSHEFQLTCPSLRSVGWVLQSTVILKISLRLANLTSRCRNLAKRFRICFQNINTEVSIPFNESWKLWCHRPPTNLLVSGHSRYRLSSNVLIFQKWQARLTCLSFCLQPLCINDSPHDWMFQPFWY